MTICNSAHLNKGQMNKKLLKWHVNWPTNCLICVAGVKGAVALRAEIYIWLEFNGPWRVGRLISIATNLSSRFSTGQNVLFLFVWNVSCEPNGAGACMYQFVSVAGPAIAWQWIYGLVSRATQWPQLMQLPQRYTHTKAWNDDIWSEPARFGDPH